MKKKRAKSLANPTDAAGQPGSKVPQFEFESTVERSEIGLRPHLIPFPDAVARAFREAGVSRLVGTLNGRPFKRALRNVEAGLPAIQLGKSLLKELGVRRGARVEVVAWADPRPDAVDVPEEFLEALAQDREASARWLGMTPGKKRSLCHYVASAKRPETRIKRAVELADKLRTHTLYGDSPNRPKSTNGG